MPLNGDEIEKAGNGLSKLLDSLGNFFSFAQKYWKGIAIFLVAALIVVQWYWIGSRYDKGYNVAKKEDENEMASLKRTVAFQDRQIQIIQSQYDTLYVKWRESKEIAYQQLIIKKQQ